MEMVPLALHKHHPQQGTSRQVMPISGAPPTMSIFSYPAKLFPVLPLLLQNQKVDVSETVYTVMDVYGQRHRMATLPLIKELQVQEENRWIEPPPPVVASAANDAKRPADQAAADKKAPAKRHSKSEATSSRGNVNSSSKKTASSSASGPKGRRFSKLRAAFDDFHSDDDSSSSDSDVDVNDIDDDQRPVRNKTNEKRSKRPSKPTAVPLTESNDTNIVEDLETDEALMTTAAAAVEASTAAEASKAEPSSRKDNSERRSRKKSKRMRMSKSSFATSESSLISWSSSSESESSSASSREDRDRDRDRDPDHDSDMDKAADKEDIAPDSRKAAAHESKDDEDQQCIVCLSDTREVILFPCRHLNTCLPCAKMLIASRNQCPVCRSTAEAIIHVVAFHEASPDDNA